MVGVLVRLKLTSLRHSLRGGQASLLWLGGTVGLGLAVATASLGLAADAEAALDQLAIALAVWGVLWLFLPVVGGAGDPLRPESFALLPIASPRLAAGLLGASFFGILPTITIVAAIGLVIVGLSLGAGPTVVAVIGVILLVTFVIVLSKVALSLLGQAMHSRLGVEVAALQYALLLSSTWIWIPIVAVASTSQTNAPEASSTALPTIARWLPTGWPTIAVDAANRSDWPAVALALGAMGVLIVLLTWGWAKLLERRLTQTGIGGDRSVVPKKTRRSLLDRALPPTALGAVVARELRSWARHPRRRIEFRVAYWTAVILAVVPGLLGATWMWPFAGAIVVMAAGITSANVYGMDGTSLWLTLMLPGRERTDVLGRQLAWLIAFGAIALGLTVILTAFSGADWAWPLVLAAMPALIGGAAGLVPSLVPLAIVLSGSDTKIWFAPLYLAEPLRLPAIAAFGTAGLVAYALAWRAFSVSRSKAGGEHPNEG